MFAEETSASILACLAPKLPVGPSRIAASSRRTKELVPLNLRPSFAVKSVASIRIHALPVCMTEIECREL